MEFIHRILSFGIAEDTKISTANRIKALNAFYLTIALVLLISIVLVLIFGPPLLQVINLIFLGLFILFYLLIPPYKKPNSSSVIAIILTGLMLLSGYALVKDLSGNVILAFLLMYPIIAITIQARRGLWISTGLGVLILVMNFFPLTETFQALPYFSLAVYAMIYGVTVLAAYFIEQSQSKLLKQKAGTAEFYESEIMQKDVFISQLSHKLRTSLSNITLINSLVQDSKMNTAQKELLETLKTSTFELINDVNDLVEITTPAIIDFKQSILSFSLNEALHGTMAILDSDEDFDTEVELMGVDRLGYQLIGDPSLLRSVLINLIKGVDEFRFTNTPVALTVSIDHESQNLYRLLFSLEFNVENKAGLKSLLNSIQNKSEQRTSKLNNTNHLLALTGSMLEFSFDKQRPVIYFFQEISKDPTKKIAASEVLKKDKPVTQKGDKRSLKQAALLLVEDNAINQKIVLLSLHNQVKQIDVASNGKEALDMFGTKKYDVILMDIQMPVMDGLTATKKIREIESTSEERVPILAITANALAGDRDNCLAAGVDDYVSKPFQVDEVIRKISALLSK